MEKKKLAVILPGMGYTKDKPLLYYSGKILANEGYKIRNVTFTDLPKKIQGNLALILEAADIAYGQVVDQLKDVDFSQYEDVIFIGKSIGTIASSRYIREHAIQARQIWYTPLQATLDQDRNIEPKKVLAFIGNADPWSDIAMIRKSAGELKLELHIYDGCNHSLESPDVDRNIAIMREVMKRTKEFVCIGYFQLHS
ncbi:MAG: alpha/beta hydrolase [Lachnospiraceae bacterium]|nr:alpha/beta hydrolase [Lachnospiraceae bacterium]